MRKILFRAKRLYDGEWIEGNLFIPDLPDTPTQICIGTNVVRISYDVDPNTIGQFTGLYDKNGKKIFEGDIVKTEFGRLCICVWFENRVVRCWDLASILTSTNLIHPAPYKTRMFDSEYLEVVGNIYDNPELLEEKK